MNLSEFEGGPRWLRRWRRRSSRWFSTPPDPSRLLAVLAKYVVMARGDDGCRNIDLCGSVVHDRRFVVISKWQSPDRPTRAFRLAGDDRDGECVQRSPRQPARDRPARGPQRPRSGMNDRTGDDSDQEKGWCLLDAAAQHEAEPDSFPIPSLAERTDLHRGDKVKLVFVLDPAPSSGPNAERMWVEVSLTRAGRLLRGLAHQSTCGHHVASSVCGDRLRAAACRRHRAERGRSVVRREPARGRERSRPAVERTARDGPVTTSRWPTTTAVGA